MKRQTSFTSLDEMRVDPFYRFVMGTGEPCSSIKIDHLLASKKMHKLICALSESNELNLQRLPNEFLKNEKFSRKSIKIDPDSAMDQTLFQNASAPLSEKQIGQLLSDEYASLTLAKIRPKSFMRALELKYEAEPSFINYILDCDLELFRHTMNRKRFGLSFTLFSGCVRNHFQSF